MRDEPHDRAARPLLTATWQEFALAVRVDGEQLVVSDARSDGGWRCAFGGLVMAVRTDPAGPGPAWGIGGTLEHLEPVSRVEATVLDSRGDRSFAVRHTSCVWLAVLPPASGSKRVRVRFVGPRGQTVEELTIGPLEAMLGSEPGQAPDGSGWASYAPLVAD